MKIMLYKFSRIFSTVTAALLVSSCMPDGGYRRWSNAGPSEEEQYKNAMMSPRAKPLLVSIDEDSYLVFKIESRNIEPTSYYALRFVQVREYERWPPPFESWRAHRMIWKAYKSPVALLDLKSNFDPLKGIVFLNTPRDLNVVVADPKIRIDPSLTYTADIGLIGFSTCVYSPEKSPLKIEGVSVTDPLPCKQANEVGYKATFSLRKNESGKIIVEPKQSLRGF